MKKNILYNLLFLVVLLIVILVFFIININSVEKNKREIEAYNAEYEEYNKLNANGLDVITLINKAVSNNEKKYIKKDSKGFYLDEDGSIEIYVVFNGNSYQMEKIVKLGTESFIEYFGPVEFRCIDVQYHDSGYIKSMTFEAINY